MEDEEFTWNKTIGPTAIKFFNSDKLGKQYENDIFISDIDNGNIYHFKVNQQSDGFLLTGALTDKVADTPKESQQAVFARRHYLFASRTRDGYLYFLSYTGGTNYRITPPVSENISTK